MRRVQTCVQDLKRSDNYFDRRAVTVPKRASKINNDGRYGRNGIGMQITWMVWFWLKGWHDDWWNKVNAWMLDRMLVKELKG